MKIERIWAMPNKNTFDIKPIKQLLFEEMTKGIWIDPFANKNKLATITNDINPEYKTDYNLDALEFLELFEDNSVDGVLYDPPFSPRQVSECYKDFGYNVTWDTTKASFWTNHKKQITRILKVGGKVITFGWNSGGIGKRNGFEISRILLVPHGGWHNDTICTVEVKKYQQISLFTNNDTDNLRGEYMEHDSILNIIDNQLIEEFENLPIDFWDFKNEDTKELTHGIHTYPAVMVYPISRSIIDIIKKYQKINVLMDPFMGSGTVLVEGILAGMEKAYGTDLNPLARLISKVKTKHLHYTHVRRSILALEEQINESYNTYKILLDKVYEFIEENNIDITEKATVKEGWGANAPEILKQFIDPYNLRLDIPKFNNIGFWFVPNAIIELQIIKDCIITIEDENIRDFVWVAFSETTRLVSNRRNSEFKMYRMEVQKVIKFRPDVKKEFFNILERNVEKMHAFYDKCDAKERETEVYILDNDTRELLDVPDNSIDLVITSPPYGDSRTTVAYGEFSRVSLLWANLEELSDKQITGIDKALMGGTKFKKGFEYNLNSQSLKNSLDIILKDDNNIERAGDVYSFYKDLEEGIKCITKKCKINSYQFWVVGNRTVKEENLKTSDIIIEMGEHYGLKHVYTIGRNIPNKVMPSLNSPTNEVGKKVTTMTNEHIVVLRKAR